MILGVDLGSFATKTSKLVNFNSRISSIGNILGNDYIFEFEGETYFIEEGDYDTEYRKIKREHYFKLLFSALVLSKVSPDVELIVGLPISQFQKDKTALKAMIENKRLISGCVNGSHHEYYIKSVEVYPEGVGAAGPYFEGIIVDIGGRTTDVCQVRKVNGKRKIIKPDSIPAGTIELYNKFISAINTEYGLELQFDDTERILKQGLKIEGRSVDITFAKKTFYDFMDRLINKLKLDYSLTTEEIFFTGGGSILLEGMIRKKLKHAEVSKDGVFDNARAYFKYGEEVFK